MRPLVAVLLLPAALAAVVAAFALAGPSSSGGGSGGEGACGGGRVPRPTVDRFDERRAFALVDRELALGPRPAGSAASRRLADELRAALPNGRFQPVPGGLRNVIGTVPGRDPRRTVVVGAHYDTKDIPGFLGANDGAAGTAAAVELARSLRPAQLRPTVVFALFDGEESPTGTPDLDFADAGLRGSRVAARALPRAEAMILLDFVANRGLTLPREHNSSAALWGRLRAAAGQVGVGCVFPDRTVDGIEDDQLPFLDAGVPAIDLIDFDFPCWHRRCDDRSAISERSLDAAGESVRELLATL